jgi:hypothetical protein
VVPYRRTVAALSFGSGKLNVNVVTAPKYHREERQAFFASAAVGEDVY